jgi:hypothetical protein
MGLEKKTAPSTGETTNGSIVPAAVRVPSGHSDSRGQKTVDSLLLLHRPAVSLRFQLEFHVLNKPAMR